MSSMLEQAIIDAEALKEAAIKNAENELIEKYSEDIKEAVENLLEQPPPGGPPEEQAMDPMAMLGAGMSAGDPAAPPGMPPGMPPMAPEGEAPGGEVADELAPSWPEEGEELCPCPGDEDEVTLSLSGLAQLMGVGEEPEAEEMLSSEEAAGDIMGEPTEEEQFLVQESMLSDILGENDMSNELYEEDLFEGIELEDLNEQEEIKPDPIPKVHGGQTEASTAVMDAYHRGDFADQRHPTTGELIQPSDLQFKGYDKSGKAKVELGDWAAKKSELFKPEEHGAARSLWEPDFAPLLSPRQLKNLSHSDPNEFLRQTKRHENATAEEAADYRMRQKRGFKSATGHPEGHFVDNVGGDAFLGALMKAAAGGNVKAQAELEKRGLVSRENQGSESLRENQNIQRHIAQLEERLRAYDYYYTTLYEEHTKLNETYKSTINENKNKKETISDKAKKRFESLKKENKNHRQLVLTLKEKLDEVNLSNAKLLYTNRVLNSDSLNERQKDKIVEAVSKAGTVEEAKTIFETLQSAVEGASSSKKASKSLNEAVANNSSAFLPRREVKDSDPSLMDRMQKLAGITKI